jgi:hypothetical protein
VPEFTQSLGFDLADALPGHIKDLTDLLKGFHAAIIQAVAQTQNIPFPGAQGGQHAFKIFTQQIFGNILLGIFNIGFDKVTETRILFLANRRFEGNG